MDHEFPSYVIAKLSPTATQKLLLVHETDEKESLTYPSVERGDHAIPS
jgi:hypothetical protein